MICGVGINDMPRGWRVKCKWNALVYRKWCSMLNRCYSEKTQERQPTYKGCYVCRRWLLLSNFVEDFPKINGYDEEKFLNNKLYLDKDIKSDNKNKCYCLEECLLVNNSENVKQANKHQDHSFMKCENNPYAKKVAQYNKQGNLIKIWDCIMDVERHLRINHSQISKCCRGKRKSAGGYIWKYYEED